MSRPLRRRALLYLDNHYQYAVLRHVVLQWCALVGVSLAVLSVLAVFSADDPQLSYAAVVQETLLRNLPLVIVLLALLPKFLHDSLKLSHRAVGPMIKLDGAMRAVLEGEPPQPVQIRRRDFFQEIINDYNQLIERLPSARESSELVESTSATELSATTAH